MSQRPLLNAYARRVMVSLCEILLPDDPEVGVHHQEMIDGVIARFERMMGHAPAYLRFVFPLGLFALEWGTLVFMGTLRPLSRLTPEEQDRYLDGWTKSRLLPRRELFKGVKALCMMGYYSHPAVLAHIGYEPEPWVAEAIRKRNETYGDPLDPVRDVG